MANRLTQSLHSSGSEVKLVFKSKMAAPMATHVRIKVYFENNEFDASWLLIDTSDLRTMKDVQRYISLKFLGKNIPLYLTLQGCFLPDWEKSVILRDNDCVNAKCIHQDRYIYMGIWNRVSFNPYLNC